MGERDDWRPKMPVGRKSRRIEMHEIRRYIHRETGDFAGSQFDFSRMSCSPIEWERQRGHIRNMPSANHLRFRRLRAEHGENDPDPMLP
jgi:hypothetical protein